MRWPSMFSTLVFTLIASAALADDVKDGIDHPMVGRFAGSIITFYREAALDEIGLLKAPLVDPDMTVHDESGADWLRLEGKVTRIRYQMPSGHSSLEVARSYRGALEARGFKVLFDCVNAQCLSGKVTDNYLIGDQIDRDYTYRTVAYATNPRYLLASLVTPGAAPSDQPIYVAILVGENQEETTAYVEVVEPIAKTNAANNIKVVDAGQMAAQLGAGKSVDIYGLYFDYDSADLEPDSKPTLDQIARLLGDQPNLRLGVIGHTDNQGTPDYNQRLSERRAKSVVNALVTTYGIAADRLKPFGKGLSQPVASNDTEEGRARNRRVQLIALY